MDTRFSAREASQLQKIPWRHGFYAQLDNGGAAGEQLAQRVPAARPWVCSGSRMA
jgi:hypothetical protein